MVGYAFCYGVDGFGADIAPALEEGIYTDLEKAFSHLIKLNHEMFSSGKYINCNCRWNKTMSEEEINKTLIYGTDFEDEPPYGMFAMYKVNIIK